MGSFPKPLKPSVYIKHLCLPELFNISLPASQVPDDLCPAIVTPVAKVPHRADFNLFRLISLAPVVCKVFEAILKEKMLAHMPLFSLLTSRYHGFPLVMPTQPAPGQGRDQASTC